MEWHLIYLTGIKIGHFIVFKLGNHQPSKGIIGFAAVRQYGGINVWIISRIE